jgi:hypothetical protein
MLTLMMTLVESWVDLSGVAEDDTI